MQYIDIFHRVFTRLEVIGTKQIIPYLVRFVHTFRKFRKYEGNQIKNLHFCDVDRRITNLIEMSVVIWLKLLVSDLKCFLHISVLYLLS